MRIAILHCLLIALCIAAVLLPLAKSECSSSHLNEWRRCIRKRALLRNNAKRLEDEFQALTQRRVSKCFGDGRCSVAGNWRSGGDLCAGAQVCDCALADLIFNVIRNGIRKDFDKQQYVECTNAAVDADQLLASARCLGSLPGGMVDNVHVDYEERVGSAVRTATLLQYLMARSQIDRCRHLSGDRAARATDKCWWKQADRPVGQYTCGIAHKCAKEVSTGDCDASGVKSLVGRLCECQRGGQAAIARDVFDNGDAAADAMKAGAGDFSQCRRKVDAYKTTAYGADHQAIVQHVMSNCMSDKAPFTAQQMVDSMCNHAEQTGTSWCLRHGLGQPSNFFGMYIADRNLRYCSCF